MAHACRAPTPRSPRPYSRRRPENTALHQVVRENYLTVLQQAEAYGNGYPAYVRKEFERYLACGDLTQGFSRIRCEDCKYERLVAFSCKGRLCPSCLNRRMEQTAMHLEESVLPPAAYRQWTLTIPWQYRMRLASDKELLSRVNAIFVRAIFSAQRQCARKLGITDPKCGSVTFIHRFNTLLRLSPHLHGVVPDGVFYQDDSGAMAFAELLPPTDAEVTHILQRCATRIERLFCDAISFDEEPDDDDAMAATLAEAAQPLGQVALIPVVPNARHLAAQIDGYSIHADVAVAADDRQGLARLLRYGARPPLAANRVSITPDGKVKYELRKVLSGRSHITLDPDAFVRRLASLIAPPWLNLTRFHGVFSANSKHHQAVKALVPKPVSLLEQIPEDLKQLGFEQTDPVPAPLPKPLRIKWGDLLRRTFADVLVCPKCEGSMRLVATIEERDVIEKILSHLELPTEPVPSAPARDPPQLMLNQHYNEGELDSWGN